MTNIRSFSSNQESVGEYDNETKLMETIMFTKKKNSELTLKMREETLRVNALQERKKQQNKLLTSYADFLGWKRASNQ